MLAHPCAPASPPARSRRALRALQTPTLSSEHSHSWVTSFDDGNTPCLSGNFGPVSEATVPGLRVEGVLPSSVDGLVRCPLCLGRFHLGTLCSGPLCLLPHSSPQYIRNGPNPLHAPLARAHWFDGVGMCHAFRLRSASNSADYVCRYVRTRAFEAELAAGRRVHRSITEPPAAASILLGVLAKMRNAANVDSPYWAVQTANTANNGLCFHGGRLLATYEAGSAYELGLSPELPCLGVCSFAGGWSWLQHWTQTFSAHPKLCGATGELVSHGYNMVPAFGPPTVTVTVMSPSGDVVHSATLPTARASLQHDVGITATRTILLDGPLVFNLAKSLAGAKPFDYFLDAPLRFGIMPRRGDAASVLWIEAEPCFAYHVVNCWDDPVDPDRVVVILCRSSHTRALGMADVVGAGGGEPERSYLHRFVLCTRTAAVVESTRLSSVASDFPALHPAFVGQPLRYAFTAGFAAAQPSAIPQFDALLRHDLATGAIVTRQLPAGTFCGDVSFAPAGAGASDDGHVLLLTHVLGEERSELLVLDARDIAGPLVAVVRVPRRIPYGFHATFVPGCSLPGWP